MTKIKRILVPLDGSALAETIVPVVTTLAQGLGAAVTLLHVTALPTVDPDAPHQVSLDRLADRYQAQAAAYLQGVAQRLQAAGIAADAQVAFGDAPEQIIQQAVQRGVGLIALATHGRSGILRWIYGSVAEKVAQTAEIPVLLVRPQALGTSVAWAMQEVVVPLDGTTAAESALPYAEELAGALKVPVVLFRVVEPRPLPDSAFGEVVDQVRGGFFSDGLGGGGYAFGDPAAAAGHAPLAAAPLTADAQGYLDATAGGLHARGLTVSAAVATGSPASEIIASARPGTLVVMAAHGHDGLSGLTLGSIARRVAQHIDAPVLFVRP